MNKFLLTEETYGYVTAEDDTNADKRLLTIGSQNVLVDRNRKVKTRPGFTRLGAASTAETPPRNGFTWFNSTGGELPMRFPSTLWQVYLGTIDGTEIDTWVDFKTAMDDEAIPRGATWFDTGENIDLMILVQSDANLYEWNGAVAVVSSADSGAQTVTKAGTNTFAQNRFYTTRNKTFFCVRTGTEYTYTGGESTTTLTTVTTGGVFDLVAGDVLIQKVVTQSNKPGAGHTNDTIFSFENQLCIGSNVDNEVWISQNDDYDDFSYSAPRVPGEGGLLTLDGPTRAFGTLGSRLTVHSGRSSVFAAKYEQIAVGTTIAETLSVQKLNVGVDQAAKNQECLVPVGKSYIYLSHEPAVRIVSSPDDLEGLDPKALSNPIKPDFDLEDFTSACAIWYKNKYILSAPNNSKLYILEFVEDADGKVRRFWNPPQILPVRAFSLYGSDLLGHSNGVVETYELFTGVSDYVPGATIGDDGSKVAVHVIAAYAYNLFGSRALLKKFDEYFVEGEATTNVNDLLMTLNYDYGGSTQTIERTIDAGDEDIIEGNVGFNSLGQSSLGANPLGGLTNPPDDAKKFNVTFEIANEDFRMLQAVFSTNEIDRYWAITAHGPNAVLSPRKNITHKK